MEALETKAQAQPVETPTSPMVAAEAISWELDRPGAAVRLERPVEVVHWSVVALTVVTAICVLFSAYGRSPSEPRELLPIVIYAS